MSNEDNTPAKTDATSQDNSKTGVGAAPSTQPSGEPKHEGEQKTAPAQNEKDEPARK